MTFYDYLFSHIHYTFSLSIRCQPPSTFATRSHFSLFTMTTYDYFFSSHFHPPLYSLTIRWHLVSVFVPRSHFSLSGLDVLSFWFRSSFTLASIIVHRGLDLASLWPRSSSILVWIFFHYCRDRLPFWPRPSFVDPSPVRIKERRSQNEWIHNEK